MSGYLCALALVNDFSSSKVDSVLSKSDYNHVLLLVSSKPLLQAVSSLLIG